MASGNFGIRANRRKRQICSEINITPFVDVMLVLLVIFMVTSPMMTTGINVDLPKTAASAISSGDEPVIISIDKSGNVYLQENKVKPDELTTKLKAVLQNKLETRLFIRGDKSVDYGQVMVIFGLLQNAGFKNIALVSESLS